MEEIFVDLFEIWTAGSPPAPSWADAPADGNFDLSVFDERVFDTGTIWATTTPPAPSWATE